MTNPVNMRSLAGQRVLVAGASSGIGREMAIRAVREGAQVLLTARRQDQLEQVCAAAGGGRPVAADIRLADGCDRVADAAREHLGGIDVLVCTVGAAPLRMLADTTEEDWRHAFDTNVVATHRLVHACLPLLTHRALVMCMSSEAVRQQRTAMAAYAASKAALERLVEGWRAEHPEFRFTRVTVGATIPTGFANDFDPELLTRALDDWSVRGLAQSDFMTAEEVGDVLAGVIAAAIGYPGVGIEDLTIRSPSPIVGTFGSALEGAMENAAAADMIAALGSSAADAPAGPAPGAAGPQVTG